MSRARIRLNGSVAIALVSLFLSVQAFAVGKPASVAIIIDRSDQQALQAADMLYEQTWVMLDGEFDVRFSTPRMEQVDQLYQDNDVDVIVALGNAGIDAVAGRSRYEKPTIVIAAQTPITASDNNLVILHSKQASDGTKIKEDEIKQLVIAVRDRLRAR